MNICNKRRIDKLGRIVIPIDIRRELSISDKDTLIVYLENDKIVICKDKKEK